MRGNRIVIVAMHGVSTMHSNIRTDIRIAGEVGFDGLEILASKLIRYLDQGLCAEELMSLLQMYSVQPVCINALRAIDCAGSIERNVLLNEAKRLCITAELLGCPTIQLLPIYSFEGIAWDDVLELVAHNVADIADIGMEHGVRFQLETVAWTAFYSLSRGLELIEKAGRDNVGLVIDFWQMWVGGETTPSDVAALDSSTIYGVHLCDGVSHTNGSEWAEEELRSYLPGEGMIPIEDWVAAVNATGFDGYFSLELLSPKHWEWDLVEIARETKARLENYLLANAEA